MKKITGFILAITLIAFAGCGKKATDNKATCKKVIEHSLNIMKNDPAMQKAGKEVLDKILEGAKKEMDKRVAECVKGFDQGAADCILASKSMQELTKCRPSKPKE